MTKVMRALYHSSKEDKTSGCVSHEKAHQIYLTLQANVELVSSQCRRQNVAGSQKGACAFGLLALHFLTAAVAQIRRNFQLSLSC